MLTWEGRRIIAISGRTQNIPGQTGVVARCKHQGRVGGGGRQRSGSVRADVTPAPVNPALPCAAGGIVVSSFDPLGLVVEPGAAS